MWGRRKAIPEPGNLFALPGCAGGREGGAAFSCGGGLREKNSAPAAGMLLVVAPGAGRALGQALGPGSSKCVSSAAEWLGMLRTAWESVSPLIIKAKRVSGLRYFGGTAAVTLSGPPVSNGRSSWI